VIWDLVDPLDGWTSLRHLRDRLMGQVRGILLQQLPQSHHCYGRDAGRPGPAAVGGLGLERCRPEERGWRPLAAAANWVMDDNHRGTWPEIASEPCPAYFSPPSGLFVAAVVEALFA